MDVADDERRVDDRFPPPELERVQHDHLAPRLAQRTDRVRPDVPGTAGDEDCGF